MSIFFDLVAMLGGLAMFLYGMEVMGDGLKSSSAEALKRVLGRVTSRPISGFLLGVLVTAVIQSSTATIVLTVGLLGAGVLNLKQSISITVGANVGTTVTGQIIRLLDVDGGTTLLHLFQPSTLAPLAMIMGIIFIKFLKKDNMRTVGIISMGFGVLFVGLLDMTAAMEPISATQGFSDIVLAVSDSPVLGLLCGLVITSIVQSSSASVGILQTLSQTGQIGFAGAYGYVVGAALGTCITTAIICSIGTQADAKRTVTVDVLYNIIGAALCLIIVTLLHRFGVIDGLWNRMVDSSTIANFQTVFKLLAALSVIPFIPKFERFSRRLIKDVSLSETELLAKRSVQGLDEHLFMSPGLALAQTEEVIGRMAEYAIRNYDSSVRLLRSFDQSQVDEINRNEDILDHMADVSNQYLVDLSPRIISEQENSLLSYLIQALTAFERIGDIAVNIMRSAANLYQSDTHFSDAAMRELDTTTAAVHEVLQLTVTAFNENDMQTARKVEPLEEVVDDMVETLKARHIERIKTGLCSIGTGIYFNDILINLERISDHCSDMAVYTIQRNDSSIKGKVHSYIQNLHDSGDDQYIKMYSDNRKKYMGELDETFDDPEF